MTDVLDTSNTDAVELIDEFLAEINGRELVSTNEVSDVLLDLRLILSVN